MRPRLVAIAVLSALAALACSDGDTVTSTSESTTTAPDDTAPDDTMPVDTMPVDLMPVDLMPTTTEAPIVLTASAPGVTEDTIRLGFLGIDFDTLRSLGLVDINRGDFDLIVDAFVDDLNARGGIHGRMVEARVEEVSPVDLQAADTACLAFTEDAVVFAVIGGFVGPTSTANPCFTTQHDTILIGGAPTPTERAAARAPWITTILDPARHLPAAIALMDDAGLFGDRVGVAWDQTEQPEADDFVLPALAARGIEIVREFVQGTEGGDAVQGESEWKTISERVALEGIDTMVMLEAVAVFGLQQLIANGFEGQLLVVDTTSITGSIGTSTIVPLSELDGIIGTGWLDSPEAWEQRVTQDCIAVFEAANPGITVIRSDLVEEGEPNWSASIGPLCNQFRIFEMAATNAGPDLTQETFLQGVEEIGEFELVGQGLGVLAPGVYDAAGALRLVAFDNEDLPNGGVEPFGPMVPIADLGVG